MQRAVRLAATLSALTWISPAVQAATVLQDFTLIDATGRTPVASSPLIFDGRRLTSVSPTTQFRIPAGAIVVLGTDQDTIFRPTQRKPQPPMTRVYTASQGLVFQKQQAGQ